MVNPALLALTALAAPAASASAPPPDNAVVSATIAALEAGNHAELDWLVTGSGALQFFGITPADRGAVFDALAGCKAKEQRRGQAGPYAYFVFAWTCRTGTFVGKLIPDKDGQTVTIADFLTKSEHETRSQRFPSVVLPPEPVMLVGPPPPLTPDAQARQKAREAAEMAGKKELAGLLAEAVTRGDLTDFALRHPTYATTTYGFFDPFTKREYIDRIWRSGDDLADASKTVAAAFAHARSELGAPTGWACEEAFPYVECTWRYADPGRRLTAELHVFRKDEPNWGITVFHLRYETAEKLAQAEARAAR